MENFPENNYLEKVSKKWKKLFREKVVSYISIRGIWVRYPSKYNWKFRQICQVHLKNGVGNIFVQKLSMVKRLLIANSATFNISIMQRE